MPTPGASNSVRIVMPPGELAFRRSTENTISMLGNAQRGLADKPPTLSRRIAATLKIFTRGPVSANNCVSYRKSRRRCLKDGLYQNCTAQEYGGSECSPRIHEHPAYASKRTNCRRSRKRPSPSWRSGSAHDHAVQRYSRKPDGAEVGRHAASLPCPLVAADRTRQQGDDVLSAAQSCRRGRVGSPRTTTSTSDELEGQIVGMSPPGSRLGGLGMARAVQSKIAAVRV